MRIIVTISIIIIVIVIIIQMKNDRMNLGFWETAHVPLP